MNKILVKVIIGSNYGDEGKGLATHYFSQKARRDGQKCLNVLYNGGPQRGHTVEFKSGVRHVFHHFGSGTFDDASTYFDQDFMVNPMVFMKELKEISEIKSPIIMIHPNCRVITPFDMMINQIVEKSRDTRYGSCGQGIQETKKRYDDKEYSLYYKDFELISYLKEIAYKYVPRRLFYYGINEIPNEYKSLIEDDGLIKHYVQDLFDMKSYILWYGRSDKKILRDANMVIFEGGQGLALDENYPNVTASKTTSQFPVIRMKDINCDIEICYITRSYFTRHGNGDFPTVLQKIRQIYITNSRVA